MQVTLAPLAAVSLCEGEMAFPTFVQSVGGLTAMDLLESLASSVLLYRDSLQKIVLSTYYTKTDDRVTALY